MHWPKGSSPLQALRAALPKSTLPTTWLLSGLLLDSAKILITIWIARQSKARGVDVPLGQCITAAKYSQV
jgi:hypothetical protein